MSWFTMLQYSLFFYGKGFFEGWERRRSEQQEKVRDRGALVLHNAIESGSCDLERHMGSLQTQQLCLPSLLSRDFLFDI